MNKLIIVNVILKNKNISEMFRYLYNFIYHSKNTFLGKENKISNNGAWLRNIKCKVIGNNNEIIFKSNAKLKGLEINIRGNNNKIIVGENAFIEKGEFFIEDDDNKLIVDKGSTICKDFHFACIEGTTINIGRDCLFSSNVTIRTGDSHSILNKDGIRINSSRSVNFGNHIWVGNKCTFLKGASVAEDSIVGLGSIVNKKFNESGIIIAGVPAKAIKSGINWDKSRILSRVGEE